jgi:hypothetical protein
VVTETIEYGNWRVAALGTDAGSADGDIESIRKPIQPGSHCNAKLVSRRLRYPPEITNGMRVHAPTLILRGERLCAFLSNGAPQPGLW